MQVLRKTQLFSVSAAAAAHAWMNDRPQAIYIPASEMAEHVHSAISRFVYESNEVPTEIRMNPWSVCELPGDRWYRFPFLHNGSIVIIPVVADSKVVPGRVHCVGSEETVIAMKAVAR